MSHKIVTDTNLKQVTVQQHGKSLIEEKLTAQYYYCNAFEPAVNHMHFNYSATAEYKVTTLNQKFSLAYYTICLLG